jgi:hypothetical protein
VPMLLRSLVSDARVIGHWKTVPVARAAEQVLNSKLALKQEIENILTDPSIEVKSLSRPKFNEILESKFVSKGWESQPPVFNEPNDPSARASQLVTLCHSFNIAFDQSKIENCYRKVIEKNFS